LDRQEQTQAQQLEAQAEWQDKIHSLETQLGDWQAKAQEQEQAHARHLEAEGVWLVKIQTLETELGEWQAKAQHAQQTMEAERSAWQQQTQDLETQLQATTRTIEALRTDQSASAQQVEALEQQLLAHEAHLADSQQQIKALQQQPTEDWRQKYLDLETRLETAQQQFTHRESGYLLQSASVEAELEQILKEYDRLTRHIVDFNAERKKYEAQISDMQQHQHRLDQQLADLKVQCLGDSQGTTMTLRKEFRQLMAQTKTDHQQQLETEQQLRLVMEQERRDEKQEWERLRWDRVNVSVQTHFVV
jgi:chromosome segregation ATPase